MVLSMSILLVLLFICTTHCSQCTTNKPIETVVENEIKIGYLSAHTSDDSNRDGIFISGAMLIAVDDINRREDLLPNHTLTFTWMDTGGTQLGNIRVMTEQWKEGVVAFFGPENTCTTEARIAAAWDIPMLSYVSIFANVGK